MNMDLLQNILNLTMKIGIILGPIFVAFYRKDRDALGRLLAAVPDIFNVVQQEKRKQSNPTAVLDPLKRALELAEKLKGKQLTAHETDRVTAALQSQHEYVRSVNVNGSSVSGGSIQLSNAALPSTAPVTPGAAANATSWKAPPK